MSDKDYFGWDKVKHFGVCLVLSLYSTELAVGAAIGKEYGDAVCAENHCCRWDLLADLAGVIIGTTIRVLIIKRYNWF